MSIKSIIKIILFKCVNKINLISREGNCLLLYKNGGFNSIPNIIYPSKIYGTQYMEIGKNFRSGIHLWMQAIDFYYGQKFTPKLVIGDNFSASDFLHIGCVNEIKIGNNVLIGSKVLITDHNHGVYSGNCQSSVETIPTERCLSNNKKIIIGNNVWLGDNVIILPDTIIGDGAVIGANSVIKGMVPEGSIVVSTFSNKIIKKYNKHIKKWVNEN